MTRIETLVGRSRPAIYSRGLYAWLLEAADKIIARCPIERAVTYYFAVDGDDANPGTFAQPKKTVAAAQAIHDAWVANAGGLRIHFLNHGRYTRGEQGVGNNGLNSQLIITKSNVSITGDMTEIAYTYSDHRFTYADWAYTWTVAPGCTYTHVADIADWLIAADGGTVEPTGNHGIAWIIEQTPQRMLDRPYSRQTSIAACEANRGSFFFDINSTPKKLYVHQHRDYGGSWSPRNNNDRPMSIYANSKCFVKVMPGADNFRMDGFVCIGFGIDPIEGKTGGFAFMSIAEGNQVHLCSNVHAFYGSSKILVHEANDNPGGIVMFMDCRAGYCNPNPGGQVTYNGYNSVGDHSFLALRCGTYPALPAPGNPLGNSPGGFGGHGNGGSKIGEYYVVDCYADTIGRTGASVQMGYGGGVSPGDLTAPSARDAWGEYKYIALNFDARGYAAVGASEHIAYINCRTGGGVSGKWSGIHINEIIDIVSDNVEGGPTQGFAFSNVVHDAWYYNSMFSGHGPWNFYLTNGLTYSAGLRIYNSIFQNLFSKGGEGGSRAGATGGQSSAIWNANLAAGSVFHNGIYNVSTTPGNGYGDGYTGDPSVINLSKPVIPRMPPSKESQAYKSAESGLGGLPLEFDFYCRVRPSQPCLGPVDMATSLPGWAGSQGTVNMIPDEEAIGGVRVEIVNGPN